MPPARKIVGDRTPISRGRRPTFDRERALDTALDLFWRHGYEGVSIAELTGAIGIAAPSLYHAFGSKADLYREVVRRYSAAAAVGAEEVDAAPSSREAARIMLERGIAAATAAGRPPGCMLSSGMLMTSADHADLAAELRDLRAASGQPLERRIARDVDEGLLPSGTDAASLTRFVVTVLQGLSVQALDGATFAQLSPVASLALAAWPAENVSTNDFA